MDSSLLNGRADCSTPSPPLGGGPFFLGIRFDVNVTLRSGSEQLIWSHIPPSPQRPPVCVSVTAMCACVGLRLAVFLFTVPLQRGRSDCVLSDHVPNITVRGSCFRRRHINSASFVPSEPAAFVPWPYEAQNFTPTLGQKSGAATNCVLQQHEVTVAVPCPDLHIFNVQV